MLVTVCKASLSRQWLRLQHPEEELLTAGRLLSPTVNPHKETAANVRFPPLVLGDSHGPLRSLAPVVGRCGAARQRRHSLPEQSLIDRLSAMMTAKSNEESGEAHSWSIDCGELH